MKNKIEIYTTHDGKVRFQKASLWLSQKLTAELFYKDIDTIGLHLKNIFISDKLEKSLTTEKNSVVKIGGTRKVSRKTRIIP